MPRFVCQECGHISPTWLGRCPACGAWNSMVEEPEAGRGAEEAPRARVVPLPEAGAEEPKRIPTGIGEIDRVLGGGLVPGSLLLLGGAPGVGKSTFLLGVAIGLARRGLRVLYASGEESEGQIYLRAKRLGGHDQGELYLSPEPNIVSVLDAARELRPALLVVDSVQTAFLPSLSSSPGSVAQVREVGARLLRFAKETETVVWMVGHLTKEGIIAGPRTLEHMVDVVLYLEGEGLGVRVLRSPKNRFGSTEEVGLFEMTSQGLRELGDPSALFLAGGPERAPGSALCPVLEGARAITVELQALVAPSFSPIPARHATGFDPSRLAMLLAVISRRAGLGIRSFDIYLNVVGGIRIRDQGADLAAVAALISARLGKPIAPPTAFFGEVGLGGEVRPPRGASIRLSETRRLGIERVVGPLGVKGVDLPVASVRELRALLEH